MHCRAHYVSVSVCGKCRQDEEAFAAFVGSLLFSINTMGQEEAAPKTEDEHVVTELQTALTCFDQKSGQRKDGILLTLSNVIKHPGS